MDRFVPAGYLTQSTDKPLLTTMQDSCQILHIKINLWYMAMQVHPGQVQGGKMEHAREEKV